MKWTVYLTRQAFKELNKLPTSIQDLADLAVHDLEEQGLNPQGWDVRKTGEIEKRRTDEASIENPPSPWASGA